MNALLLALLFSTRIASDFEIAQMKQQLAQARDFSSRVSAHLNLGDLYTSRNEKATAATEYEHALKIATAERSEARKDSSLSRYATATSFAALAHAKLRREAESFELLEEAIRYTSDSAESWNLYASAMSILGKNAKAISAARNAVAIAERDGNQLDLAVYEYALAAALDDVTLLRKVIARLQSPAFNALRAEIARAESFEIYSTARGDAAAYLSLLNRSQLRLAGLLETRGDLEGAKVVYKRVLASRTDDPTALAALARLERTDEYFNAAFAANPFSMTLIEEYRKYLRVEDRRPRLSGEGVTDEASAVHSVQAALIHIERGETGAARAILDELLQQHPRNETLLALRAEVTPREMTAEERRAMDEKTFVAEAVFDQATINGAQTVLESGTIGATRFRFSQPTAFHGTFAAGVPLRLTYRVLGQTVISGADGLLLEPLGLEVIR